MPKTGLNKDTSDDRLLIGLGKGDSEAFDYIFRRHYPNLCRFCFSMIRDADLSQSLVQNVFIKLWERRFVTGHINNLAAYLTTMVKNQVSDHVMEQKRQNLGLQGQCGTEKDESTENEIAGRNFEECLVNALARFAPRCKEAFELSRFEDLTNKEIAERMNISVKGVEALIGRSLKILRIELKDFLIR